MNQEQIKSKIIEALSELSEQETLGIYGFQKRLQINKDSIRSALKELREDKTIQLVPCFSEETGLAAGSGYWLTSKNNPNILNK